MPRHSLVAYTIRFNRLRDETLLPMQLRGMFDPYSFYLERLRQSIGTIISMPLLTKNPAASTDFRAFRILAEVRTNQADRRIAGMLEYGDYGRRTNIYDVNTGDRAHTKTADQSEFLRFYYTLCFPDHGTCAYLLTSRFGLYSPKESFSRFLKVSLRDGLDLDDRQVIATFNPVVNNAAFREYVAGGELRELRLRAVRRPQDARDLLTRSEVGGRRLEEGEEMEVVLRHRGTGGFTGRVKAILGNIARGEDHMQDLVEVYGLGEYEDTVVSLEKDGKTKKFVISRGGDAAVAWDINDQVQPDPDGFGPSFDSINRAAVPLLRSILE